MPVGERPQAFVDGGFDDARPLGERRAAESVQTGLVRGHFHNDKSNVGRRGQDRFDIGDSQLLAPRFDQLRQRRSFAAFQQRQPTHAHRTPLHQVSPVHIATNRVRVCSVNVA